MNDNYRCKGCWELGNNCQVCRHCRDTEAAFLRNKIAKLESGEGLFAISICCVKPEYVEHNVCVVKASNQYEAIGAGMVIARKIYPPSDDWHNHHVATCNINNVVNP